MCISIFDMLQNCISFLPDIQSINSTRINGLVLFCESARTASLLQHKLHNDFGINAITDVDNMGTHYAIPIHKVENAVLDKFIQKGWNWDRDQDFYKYTMTLYNPDTAKRIYNTLVAHGYNVTIYQNGMQLDVVCLAQSARNDEMVALNDKLISAQKSSPMSMDIYFNKILFSGKIENPEYRNIKKREFSLAEIEKNKDSIVREIVFQYFNKRVRSYLNVKTLVRKFDANKLDNKTQNQINMLRDYLYNVVVDYIDMQTTNASHTNHSVIIRFDYLKSCNNYNNVYATIKCAKRWCNDIKKEHQKTQQTKQDSMRQAIKVMDCDDGFYFVRLYGDNALQFEGQHMHHCIQNQYYVNEIKRDNHEYYSLRDENGEPYITLEIINGQVIQCQGRSHMKTNPKIREMVRKFIFQNKFEIVNTWNKHIAYTYQDGKLYDVFDLPKNFILNHSIDLCGMDLDKLPDMSSVLINSDFGCATNNLHDLTGAPYSVLYDVRASKNPLQSLRGMPRFVGGKIYLSGTQLTPKSFVPMYMENMLDKIVGVNEKTITAWRQQIENRKTQIANIVASLNNHTK